MAKRPSTRSEASDAAATAPQPKSRRARNAGDREKMDASSGPRPDAVDAGETTASEGTSAGTISNMTASGTRASTSPAGNTDEWSPSDEDIRVRAYHRYLERGGGDGMAFEDWLEAERDLRSQKSEIKSQK